MTQIYIKQNTHKHKTQNLQRTSPLGITPVQGKKQQQQQHLCIFRELVVQEVYRFVNCTGVTKNKYLRRERDE